MSQPRTTPTTQGQSPSHVRLAIFMTLRDRWLNPPEWVEWITIAAGFPKQPVPRDDDAATELKRRTLTKLYNARPQWLDDAHAELDAAVAAAYGWNADIDEEDALRRLLELGAARLRR